MTRVFTYHDPGSKIRPAGGSATLDGVDTACIEADVVGKIIPIAIVPASGVENGVVDVRIGGGILHIEGVEANADPLRIPDCRGLDAGVDRVIELIAKRSLNDPDGDRNRDTVAQGQVEIVARVGPGRG